MFHVYYGSGRAKCVLCSKIIKEYELQLNFSGYHTSSNAHISCIQKAIIHSHIEKLKNEFGGIKNDKSESK